MRYCLPPIFIAVIALTTLAERPVDRTLSEELFVRRIEPLLKAKCLGCHGDRPDEIEGGLDFRVADAMLRGGDTGLALIDQTEPKQSPLLLAVQRSSDEWSPMPPKESEGLNAEQIGWLERWISLGAHWPDEARQVEIESDKSAEWSAEDGVQVKTSGGLDDGWTHRRYDPASLWCYQPVKKPAIPEGNNAIDWLLEQRAPKELSLAARAERRTLIRRATFDLTGLPPTPTEVARFCADSRSDKEVFADLVDRLLASPRYGERMAQHWLDVARYADSAGLANDFERGNAWRYRDYVIRAFNNDKPFDQFVREQIAGDEIAPDNPEAIIATGFLRMGPWELTGMEVAKIARQRFLDDVTNSVGEVFLSHSLQCARCHDHKFDPIPTRDYYSVQAIFATTQLAERRANFLPVENTDGFDEKRYLQQKREAYHAELQQLDLILLDNALHWFEETGHSPEAWMAAVAEAKERGEQQLFNAARARMKREKVAADEYPPKLVGFTPEQFGMERVARKGLQRLTWAMERYEPFALSVYNGDTPVATSVTSPTRIPEARIGKGILEKTCILTGGDPFSPAEPVPPGALTALTDMGPLDVNAAALDGKRTALANWIASPANSLTTRSIVNRIWMWHFDRPIAGNPNNFGSTGKRPTHPLLLDWLAAMLVEDRWSIKSLHRRIMNSAAYCRSSQHPSPELLTEYDPNRESYACFTSRRLSAEELRDSMLLVSGELKEIVGGIPCRPEINMEVALQPRQVMGSFAAAWVPNPKPEQRHRRSIYTLKLRGLADPMMEVFNSPSRDFSCERRNTSTVTPQAFSLLHSKATHARALAFAERILRDSKSDDEALRGIFEHAYSRPPSQLETDACRRHWREIEKLLNKQATPQMESVPLQIVRDAIEENTGEQFSFVEQLYAYADFEPDLQPAQVSNHVRALADLCLVIINSNEFVYVD